MAILGNTKILCDEAWWANDSTFIVSVVNTWEIIINKMEYTDLNQMVSSNAIVIQKSSSIQSHQL